MSSKYTLRIKDDTKLYLSDEQKSKLQQIKWFVISSDDSSNIRLKQARIHQITQAPVNSPYEYYMNIQQIVKLVIGGETCDVQLDQLIKFSLDDRHFDVSCNEPVGVTAVREFGSQFWEIPLFALNDKAYLELNNRVDNQQIHHVDDVNIIC